MGELIISPIIIFVLLLLLTVAPWVLALMSKRARGADKLIWFLSAFVASWLGYFAFYYLVLQGRDIADKNATID
ncbi:hypothetical protein [Thalassotalea euphylliae]|uniref:Cardiolipin synthase N-terminal domain-containing protein n=1 Tax=Thalassotalea euphylliae TaxID=1655234 RepID=A0A3E0UFR5_9GAMM|nr:hypothetical protein [Thalassotalea euphylliae]REL35858.1 hypothetical protein DXX92_11230 [Thalassotalea euphylliae]